MRGSLKMLCCGVAAVFDRPSTSHGFGAQVFLRWRCAGCARSRGCSCRHPAHSRPACCPLKILRRGAVGFDETGLNAFVRGR